MVEYTGPSSGGGHAGLAPGMRKSGPGGAGGGRGGGSPVVPQTGQALAGGRVGGLGDVHRQGYEAAEALTE